MNQRIYLSRPPSNPILQFIYFLVGGLVLIGAVLMGAVILAFVLGAALIVGIVVWIRVWWLQRKMRRSGAATDRNPAGPRRDSGDSEIIEVEYTVIEERDARDSKD